MNTTNGSFSVKDAPSRMLVTQLMCLHRQASSKRELCRYEDRQLLDASRQPKLKGSDQLI